MNSEFKFSYNEILGLWVVHTNDDPRPYGTVAKRDNRWVLDIRPELMTRCAILPEDTTQEEAFESMLALLRTFTDPHTSAYT